jgi:hypothetical protein
VTDEKETTMRTLVRRLVIAAGLAAGSGVAAAAAAVADNTWHCSPAPSAGRRRDPRRRPAGFAGGLT